MVVAAAELMRVKGVAATSVDDVLRVSAASKSQYYQYFGSKDSLVAAAAAHQSEEFLASQVATLKYVRNLRGLRRWRDALVHSNSLRNGAYGCLIGSLAIEIASTNEPARLILDRAFTEWQDLMEQSLRRMQSVGVLAPDADVEELATGLIAAVEGGYLLGQIGHNSAPVATSIDIALDRLEVFVVEPSSVPTPTPDSDTP